MAHDRIRDDPIDSTQEYLATMPGVRRPTVSIAAGAMEAASLITYQRGAIVLTDRPGPNAVTCECYRATCGDVERSWAIARARTRRGDLSQKAGGRD